MRPGGPTAPGYFAPVADATYIALTTYLGGGREGEDSGRAARMLATKHPMLHGWLIPWVHRRRGWITQQYRLDPPASPA